MTDQIQTARAIILSLPERYRPEKAPSADYIATVHFDISGPNGGQYTAEIANGQCAVTTGHKGNAACTVTASDLNYENLELGRDNPMMSVMMGKVRVSNMAFMMTFTRLFKRLF